MRAPTIDLDAADVTALRRMRRAHPESGLERHRLSELAATRLGGSVPGEQDPIESRS